MLGFRGRHRADPTRLGLRFNVLWAGQTVSFLGDYMAYISIPLFVAFLAAEGSSLELGISYALDAAPTLVLGLVGGVLLDRLRLRAVMIACDIGRASAFLYLAWVAAQGPAEHSGEGIGAVFAMAFLVGSFSSLFQSGLFTLLPSLVARRDLSLANGRMVAVQNLAVAVGPAVAGVLISTFGPGGRGFAVAFVLDAATFLVSALSIALIGPVDRAREDGSERSIGADILNGLRYVWNEVRLRVSTLALTVSNFVLGFVEATFVLAARHPELVAAPEEWQQGVLFATFGLGGIAGAVAAPRVTRLIGLGRTMIGGMITFGVAYTVFVNTTFGPVGLVYLFLSFVGLQMINVPIATIRQTYTPSVMLGRVIAASRAIAWASLPVGALAGTALVDTLGQAVTGDDTAFVIATRVAPLVVLAVGVGLLFTVIWRDTFGPAPGRRVDPRGARRQVRI